MPQKIDFLAPEPAAARAPSSATAPAGSAGRARDEASAVAPADRVALTGTALSLRRLEEELKGGEAFDAARVAQVRAAIDSGVFRVDAGAVADGLLALERLLGGK